MALCAAAALLAGCAKKSAAPALTVWCWDPSFNVYAMNEAAKIYQRDNPQVKVDVVETAWDDIQQKLTTSLSVGQTKNLPDIILNSSVGGSSWVVLANSKNPDLAMDFLNKTFAGSVELYETILPSSGAIATWIPAGNSPVYGEPNAFFGGQKIYQEIVGYSANVPRIQYGIFNYEARNNVGRDQRERGYHQGEGALRHTPVR
jgi:ABC-type glycerol-3-phosphate transport system substrate-binding protein